LEEKGGEGKKKKKKERRRKERKKREGKKNHKTRSAKGSSRGVLAPNEGRIEQTGYHDDTVRVNPAIEILKPLPVIRRRRRRADAKEAKGEMYNL